MAEKWQTVSDWSGYEVSDCGRVRSIRRTVLRADGTSQLFQPMMLAPRLNAAGYLLVRLSNPGRRKMERVHRLVALAFLAPVVGKAHVNHIDGNKRNNHAGNLEWVTPMENNLHAKSLGLGDYRPPGSGKLTAEMAAAIRLSSDSSHAIARKFGVNRKTIIEIKRGTIWKLPPPPQPVPVGGEKGETK